MRKATPLYSDGVNPPSSGEDKDGEINGDRRSRLRRTHRGSEERRRANLREKPLLLSPLNRGLDWEIWFCEREKEGSEEMEGNGAGESPASQANGDSPREESEEEEEAPLIS
ncbi:hypothetical protein SASPL_124855 [Salvia splendens]|uniref:Uncharacterized protein n=1 Tax=Salvia splendens TaxID=180675 RepID=A0A8X8XCU3_SALSN|nr:hypothetical protein SASPL_124855 [Salvia splendens]